jgi:putative membrane protein insertion efficiency factor
MFVAKFVAKKDGQGAAMGTSMSQRSRLHAYLGHIARGPGLAARGLIAAYRLTFSALVGFECRHLPTCSAYADEAIGRFGLWAGGWMTLARLCRCHPFGTSGLDFVPPSLPAPSRWFLPWRYGRWRGTNHAVDFTPPPG